MAEIQKPAYKPPVGSLLRDIADMDAENRAVAKPTELQPEAPILQDTEPSPVQPVSGRRISPLHPDFAELFQYEE
jgi:hypothetical protein